MYNDKRIRQTGVLPIQKRSSVMQSRTKSIDESPILKKVLLSSLFGLGINALSGIALVSISCLIAYSCPDPLSMIALLSLLALLPSNFLGGFAAAKKCGESASVCGILTSAMWAILSLIASLCIVSVSSSGYSLWQGILLHSASIAFCILGALAGGIKRRPSRNKRRFG